MKRNLTSRRNRRNRRRGQTLTEYVLIIAVVVVASIGVLSAFSTTVQEKISGIIHAFGGEEVETTDPIDALQDPGSVGDNQ